MLKRAGQDKRESTFDKKGGTNRFSVCTILLLFCLFSIDSALAVVYVDTNSPGGDGTSWASAYTTLEAAIAANDEGQEFWIAQGTYLPSATMYPLAGSSFYGGFKGTEKKRNFRHIDKYPTVIDGQNMLPHLFYIRKNDVRLDGLTIKRGNATGAGENNLGGGLLVNRGSAVIESCSFQSNRAGSGGAIYGFDSDLAILNSEFLDNSAKVGSKMGGALWIHLQSPEIRGCTFTGNSAGHMGGAVLLSNSQDTLITDSTFVNNSVITGGGGGISLQWDGVSPFPNSAVVERCLFQGNKGGQVGGGIYSLYFPVTVSQCKFVNNTAVAGGGLMLDYKIEGIVDNVERCLFVNNHAFDPDLTDYSGVDEGIGGAIRSYARSMEIGNSIFSSNTASNSAGAIGFHSGQVLVPDHYNPNYSVKLSNCTLYGNEAVKYGGAIQNTGVSMMYLYNCILWGNYAEVAIWAGGSLYERTIDVFNGGTSSMTLYNTDMESLDWEHGSVSENHIESFSTDPLFVDPDGEDNIQGTLDDNFQLQLNSPCIDRADGDEATECDAACYPRIDHSNIPAYGTGVPDYADIGAFENIEGSGTLPCLSCSMTSPYIPPSFGNTVIPPIIYLLLNSYGNGGTI
ncbi:MAG: hypothetical protein K9K37_01125 [Desulfocapsa sp.]|nr:hypothetical protein [Desulfocapsa sp.]